MFGLTWVQIGIIVIVATFVLGPERIPSAVSSALGMIRRARGLMAGTQATLLRDLGPELDELRRQVAELQSALTASPITDGSAANPAQSAQSVQSVRPITGG